MNLPNKLTVARLILALIFIVTLSIAGVGAKFLSLILFLAASLTDYYDGKIARATNQITPFGQLMDPVADKVLTFSAFIGFVQLGLIPAWMTILIVGRDFLITGVRLLMPPGSEKVEARKSGKHKTVFQFAAILLTLVYLTLREMRFWNPGWDGNTQIGIYFVMFAVVLITLWSGFQYLYMNKEHFMKKEK